LSRFVLMRESVTEMDIEIAANKVLGATALIDTGLNSFSPDEPFDDRKKQAEDRGEGPEGAQYAP